MARVGYGPALPVARLFGRAMGNLLRPALPATVTLGRAKSASWAASQDYGPSFAPSSGAREMCSWYFAVFEERIVGEKTGF